MKKVKIKFWGVRGSMATPGPKTVKVGGNTACLEIDSDDTKIVCDAGTGIMQLGVNWLKEFKKKPIAAYIILSHMHWDHHIGLPFFKPLYNKKNAFLIGAPISHGMSVENAMTKVMHPPYFPIPVSAIPAHIKFKTLTEKPFALGEVIVQPMKMNHPGGSLGWRFFFPNGKSLIHITDNEPGSGKYTEKIIKWMEGADVLIHDAQYSPKDYKGHKGWGHSPFTYPLYLAERAGVKKLFLFHFDPADTDKDLAQVIKKIRSLSINVKCSLAREGDEIIL